MKQQITVVEVANYLEITLYGKVVLVTLVERTLFFIFIITSSVTNFDDGSIFSGHGTQFQRLQPYSFKKYKRLTNDRAAKLLYVFHKEKLQKKIEKGDTSIFISDAIEDFEEVDWQEVVIECDTTDNSIDSDEDMPLAADKNKIFCANFTLLFLRITLFV